MKKAILLIMSLVVVVVLAFAFAKPKHETIKEKTFTINPEEYKGVKVNYGQLELMKQLYKPTILFPNNSAAKKLKKAVNFGYEAGSTSYEENWKIRKLYTFEAVEDMTEEEIGQLNKKIKIIAQRYVDDLYGKTNVSLKEAYGCRPLYEIAIKDMEEEERDEFDQIIHHISDNYMANELRKNPDPGDIPTMWRPISKELRDIPKQGPSEGQND